MKPLAVLSWLLLGAGSMTFGQEAIHDQQSPEAAKFQAFLEGKYHVLILPPNRTMEELKGEEARLIKEDSKARMAAANELEKAYGIKVDFSKLSLPAMQEMLEKASEAKASKAIQSDQRQQPIGPDWNKQGSSVSPDGRAWAKGVTPAQAIQIWKQQKDAQIMAGIQQQQELARQQFANEAAARGLTPAQYQDWLQAKEEARQQQAQQAQLQAYQLYLQEQQVRALQGIADAAQQMSFTQWVQAQRR